MSIKICVITPISHLQVYSGLGEMDMSLTHLIAEDPSGDYAKHYKEQREKGRFVILDNSAFELEQQGKGLDPDIVLDAAVVTNPSEVIATDVLFDGEATVQSTQRFIERMRDRGVLGKYRVMAVPQGRTQEEWKKCFEKLFYMEGVNTIGLSKLSVPMSWLGEKESNGNCATARLECAAWIKSECYPLQMSGAEIHLLGGDNWTIYEMQEHIKRGHTFIRSNDSSCAVWYGRYRRTFNEEGKIPQIIMGKPDLENQDPATEKVLSTIEVRAAIMENIARWHKACK